MIIIVARRNKGERYGARKYAKVVSKTNPSKVYIVTKVRVRNAKHYTYSCTCEHFVYRQKQCKHIEEFKTVEGSFK